MIFYSIIMMIAGMFSFSIYRKHLLLMLLSFEFFVLSLFFYIYLYLMIFDYEFYFFNGIYNIKSLWSIIWMIYMLVSMIRTHGGDYMNLFNILW